MSLSYSSNSRTNTESNYSGIPQQLMISVGLVIGVYLLMIFLEIAYQYVNRLSMNRTVLLENTCSMDTKTMTISQNPNLAQSKTAALSTNERSGIEFTYSFYINVNPSSFNQNDGLLHLFHKGYSSQFPLLAPGVYFRSNTNTLRVYMNTYKTWNNYLEVENIPISKWVHIALVCKENALEIFVNGNLSKKKSFEGSTPYQNYQDIVCFSQRAIVLNKSMIPALETDILNIYGAVKGLMSRLIYFNYALCYAEIQTLLNEGPSNKMDDSTISTNLPPYLSDTWWSKSY
jgi:hypothetical protein